jgi:glycosyltransferase involved in cell wall biosynthesis
MRGGIFMTDVGIVMPVYIQKPSYLQAALRSVLTQTFANYRLIIVIDGAPEMLRITKEIVKDDPRVEMIIKQTNQGIAKALNSGFDMLFKDLNIKYLTWVSSDNIYYPQFIETLRSVLHNGPNELGLVYSSFQNIDDDDHPLNGEDELAQLRKYQAQPKEILLDACLIGVSFMYKSQFAKRMEGYHLEPIEDYEYWLRLTEHCDIKYIPIELINYRVNSQYSISAQLQSPVQHRRWRYAFHLAKYQARRRLNIPTELTIIFTVSKEEQAKLDRLEDLYEQLYSNYYVIVIDLSMDQGATGNIAHISHPTVQFKWYPNVLQREAILDVTQAVETPFTMVLGDEYFWYVLELQTLVAELKKADKDVMSNFYVGNHQEIGYRKYATQKGPFYNELYRTEKLIELLKEHRHNLPF